MKSTKVAYYFVINPAVTTFAAYCIQNNAYDRYAVETALSSILTLALFYKK